MLADTQSSEDTRNVALNRVGISQLKVPLLLQTAEGPQATVATAALSVALPAHKRGAHLSRFIPLLDGIAPLNYQGLQSLMEQMLESQQASAGTIELEVTYFRRKTAPVSKIGALLDYKIKLIADYEDGKYQCRVQLCSAVTSLCPCSKEISKYGAHNQRSHIIVTAQVKEDFYFNDFIDLIEASASCQLYAVLKRSDEKFVTEHAYENPKFVEDLARDTALAFLNWRAQNPHLLQSFKIDVENFESIHNHSAAASVYYD